MKRFNKKQRGVFAMNILSNFPKENKDERGIKDYVPIIAFTIACFLAMLALIWRVMQIPEDLEELVGEPIQKVVEVEKVEAEAEPVPEKEPVVHLTDDDIIAAIVMSESGNQDMLGKVAVATTVLNRAEYFGLTIEQVANAKNAYSYPYYGVITADCYRAVEIARENRDLFPATMMWFKTKDYHTFAEPYEKIGDHYFSYLEREETE